jgi:hypothetical protein
MRESIGGTWIFSLVIIFIVLFTGYLAVSINYSRAFKVKNSIIEIIEKNEGFNNNTENEIATYLNGSSYFVYGYCECDDDSKESCEIGHDQLNTQSKKFRYCVRTISYGNNNGDNNNDTISTAIPYNRYFIRVFFRLDLPILGDILTFPVTGETKAVYFAKDTEDSKS